MIITVSSGKGNLGNYLINGKGGNRDKTKIAILDGDVKLTQKISKSVKGKDRHFHFILSAKEKLSNEKMESIYHDFKKELLDAYSDDEVNISAVLHQDTDHSHIHIMIPKVNMLTNKKLDLYYHQRDKKRFSLIKDYLDKKHNLQPAITKINKDEKLNSQIKNWKPDTEVIKNKKDKLEFEKLLVKHINDSKNILYSNHDELIKHLQDDLKLNISKVGYDYKVDDFYITLQHENSKQRVFHPFFNNDNLKYTTNENGEKIYERLNIQSATANFKNPIECEQGIESIRRKLDKENQRYRNRIEKRTGYSRKKAKQRYIQNQNPLSNTCNINNHTSSVNNLLSQNSNKVRKNRDYSKANSRLLNTDYISSKNTLHENLKKLQKTNPTNIVTNLFNFKLIESDSSYSIVEDNTSKSNLIIYKTDDGIYNFFNPIIQKSQTSNEFMLKQLGISYPTISLFQEIFKLMDEIKEVLSIISDSLFESLVEKLSKNTFEKNDNLSYTSKNKSFISTNTPNRDLDLKPY